MSQDIDAAMQGWDFKPGVPQARLVRAQDGRQVIQMRVDLGLLQLEVTDRPDGSKPHGSPTYFDYLRSEARAAHRNKASFTLSEDQCTEADREFVQYYYRRICWLALHNYARAVEDADHTLRFMDFVKEHSPNDDYTTAHEQYRGFVLYHRTQAAAALEVERERPEAAIDAIHTGLSQLKDFFAAFEAEEHFDEDVMVQQLQKMEQSLRETHKIEVTLQEKLEQAVANEEYETAARLRDEIRRRQQSL